MFPAVDGTYQGRTGRNAAPNFREDGPPVGGAWRVWERLRGWDRRFTLVVDTTLALGLFVLCSGWFLFDRVPHNDLWLVAGLTFPLVLRRRAPLPIFMLIALVALVQWLIAVPLLADTALLIALFTVATESDWLAVVVAALVVEIGVIMATERWTPVGNYFKSLVFLTGMAAAALLAGVVVEIGHHHLGTCAPTRVRARSAKFSRRGGRKGTHREGNARCGLPQHSGHGDSGRCGGNRGARRSPASH